MPSPSSQLFGQHDFAAQPSIISELTRRSYDLTRQVAELNLRLFQHMLLDAATATRQVLAAPDPFQAIAAGINAGQPAFDHVRAYHQDLASLFSGMRSASAPHPRGAVPAADPLIHAARAAGAAGYSRHH